MNRTASLMKYTLLTQMRSSHCLLTVILSIFMGFLCVPGMLDGYQIFYLGGVRGIYNSAWLGAIAAMLPSILLWLPGFYLLRSQISEDGKLHIGQAIASAPISKWRYISGKFLGNFSVLFSSALIFTVAVMLMQLLRHENVAIHLDAYVIPLLFITAPELILLAALTILMDVIHCFKGVFGNILIFLIWVILSSISVAQPGSPLDVFGIGYVLNQMLSGARAIYPNLPEAASFGYYPHSGTIPTFLWDGIVWKTDFLLSRFLWVGVAFICLTIAALVFDRFRTPQNKQSDERRKNPKPVTLQSSYSLTLSPVKKSSRASFFALLKGELRIMLSGKPLWWYICVLCAIACSYFVAMGEGLKWISLIMLLPMGVWSQMGCREKIANTTQLIASSCPKLTKYLTTLAAGIVISLLMSGGVLLRFAVIGQWQHFAAWGAGALFLPALALLCGTVSGSRTLFEGLYIALLYFGPINDMWRFDFLGIQSMQTVTYGSLFVLVTILGIRVEWISKVHT